MTGIRTLCSLVLLTFSNFAYAEEKTWSLSAGVGRRPLVNIEQGVEDYLDKAGYLALFPDLGDSVDFSSYQMPYFLFELRRDTKQFEPLRQDDMQVVFALDWATSYLIGGDVEKEWYPLDYEGTDLGNLNTTWETFLQVYVAPGIGVDYALHDFRFRKLAFKPSIVASGGVSYFNVDVDLLLEYKPNDFMATLLSTSSGQQMLEDMGFWMERGIHADLNGYGLYVDPKFRLELGWGPIRVIGQVGPRWERARVYVKEVEDGEVSKSQVGFNIDGFTSEALLQVDF
jgi:hypothetical protein